MTEIDTVEINEATIRVESTDAPIILDEETSRAIYEHAWAKFEEALGNTNALYNETPEGQEYQFNRAKRLLWEVNDLKRYVDVLFSLTALPEEEIDSE